MPTILSNTELAQRLSVPDLTDPHTVRGHGLQKLIDLACRALTTQWQRRPQIIRTSPVVSVENNYDRLNYPIDGAARESRYTCYISQRYILRTQTSAAIPDLLSGLPSNQDPQTCVMLPGLVYRRDCIDRLHCAEPHQLDIWRIVNHRHLASMKSKDLKELIQSLMTALIPGVRWRLSPSPHPYTVDGVQIDAYWNEEWVEVGECGLVHPDLLTQAKLDHHSGLAMGLGLDRLMMIRTQMPDIRLLRNPNPSIQQQMQDLSVYRSVSNQPAIIRDLSLVVDADLNVEVLGDEVRRNVAASDLIEDIRVVQQTSYNDLPTHVIERLGMTAMQKNILLRLTIRDLTTSLTSVEANAIRNDVYRTLHCGQQQEIAE